MAYTFQNVLPSNWGPPGTNNHSGVRGLGLAPIANSTSGPIPAFPMPIPSVARFRTRTAEMRQAVLPSLPGNQYSGHVSATATKPQGAVYPFMRNPIGKMNGLGAYSAVSNKPFYETAGCGCSGLGDLALPVVGDVDMKTIGIMVGLFFMGSKLLSGFKGAAKSFRPRRTRAVA